MRLPRLPRLPRLQLGPGVPWMALAWEPAGDRAPRTRVSLIRWPRRDGLLQLKADVDGSRAQLGICVLRWALEAELAWRA